MSQGYSMKHIGITIIVSLIVVVLISPLLRPKDSAVTGVPGTAESSPELRRAVTEYRDTMGRLRDEAASKFDTGAVPFSELLFAQLEYDLAQLDFFALDAPGRGNGAARAVVKSYYLGKLEELLQTPGAAEDTVRIRVMKDACLARIELARIEPELAGNRSFSTARSEWEHARNPENLKKMYEAEFQ